MPSDLLKTSSGEEKFIAVRKNKKMRDMSQNDRYYEVRECSALRPCCFMSRIPPIEGSTRTSAG